MSRVLLVLFSWVSVGFISQSRFSISVFSLLSFSRTSTFTALFGTGFNSADHSNHESSDLQWRAMRSSARITHSLVSLYHWMLYNRWSLMSRGMICSKLTPWKRSEENREWSRGRTHPGQDKCNRFATWHPVAVILELWIANRRPRGLSGTNDPVVVFANSEKRECGSLRNNSVNRRPAGNAAFIRRGPLISIALCGASIYRTRFEF